mmetsp:Transcript_29299/g.55358  ORF Transcript_29299/g.55358 Transcript_29299/m.55358 type:complete len:1135 (-) Transcript_29299:64-3468(-)
MNHALAELGPGELAPALVDTDPLAELLGPLERLHFVNEDLDGTNKQCALLLLGNAVDLGELLVDDEGLLVKHVLLSGGDLGNLRSVEVVQPVDVLHDLVLITLDSCQNKQVLQVLVVGELGSLQDDTVEELNELEGQLGGEEGLDGGGNLVGVLGLGEGGLDDLVDQGALVGILLGLSAAENLGPELQVLLLNEVPRLVLEQAVVSGDPEEVLIAGSSGLLVRQKGERRVELLAVLSEHSRFVKLVVLKELSGVAVESDVDLSDGVVGGGLSVSGGDPGLKPRLEKTKAVPPLHLLDKLVDGTSLPNAVKESPHEVLVAVKFEKLSNNLGGLAGTDLLHVNLDVLEKVVRVQVSGHLVNEVVPVADVDERTGVGELGVHEEALDLGGVVDGRITADAFNLLELAELAGGLDVLEVRLRLLARVHDGTEVVVEALVALEVLEDLDALLDSKLVVVLLTDLDDELQVAGPPSEKLPEELDGMLSGEVREESHNELGVHVVGVGHDTLDVGELGEVLGGALEETGLLAELGDVLAVVVCKHAVLHDGVGDLRRPSEEIHLEELGLEGGLVLLVLLESLKQEGCTLLDPVHGHEHVGSSLDVDEGPSLGASELLSELDRSLGVLVHELLEHHSVVAPEADLGSVSDKLVELSALGEAVDGLLRDVRPQVNRKGHLEVGGGEEVSKLLTALEFVILQPLGEQVGAALLEDGAGELDGLRGVQLAHGEQGREVLEDGLGLAGLGRNLLEPLDGLGVPEDALGRLGGELGGTGDVLGGHQPVELGEVELLGSGKVHPSGEADGELVVAKGVHDVADEGLLVHLDLEDLALLHRNAEDAAGRGLGGGDEDCVGGDPAPVEGPSRVDVEHEEVTHLGDHEDDVVLGRLHHGNREVVGRLLGHGDGLVGAEDASGSVLVLADLHDEKLVSLLRLLLLEDEDLSGVGAALRGDGGEGTGVTVQHLRDALGNAIKLHGSGNSSGSLADASQQAKLSVRAQLVVDDLGTGPESRIPVENLLRSGVPLDGPVVHGRGGDESHNRRGGPAPERDGLRHVVVFHPSLEFQVEDLQCLTGPEGDNLGHRVHNSRLGGHRLPVNSIVVLHVDHAYLGLALRVLLTDCDHLVRLHRARHILDRLGIYPKRRKI